MLVEQFEVSTKSIAVLKLIAECHTYEQILAIYPGFTYLDIFAAAGEVIALLLPSISTTKQTKYAERLAKVKHQYPRAYEKWTDLEEVKLNELFSKGMSTKEIAEALQRQSGGIKSRLIKLGLVADVKKLETRV